MKGLSVRAAEGALDVEQARDIRRSVLCGGLNWPRDVVDGPLDEVEGAALFLAQLGPKPLASARLRVQGDRASVELLAVLERFRRQGVGRELLAVLEREASARGAGVMLALAPPEAAPFLQDCGYLPGAASGGWLEFSKKIA